MELINKIDEIKDSLTGISKSDPQLSQNSNLGKAIYALKQIIDELLK